MMIRKEIQDTLKISDNMMLNRRRLVVRDNSGVDDMRSLESDVHLMSKFAFKLQKMFNLHKKIQKSQKLHNLFNVLLEDVLKAFPKLPSEVRDFVGEFNAVAIENIMNDSLDHFESLIEFIDDKIAIKQGDISTHKSSKHKDVIRGLYAEDPKRCLRWHITSDTSPECCITPDVFLETYGENWQSTRVLGEDDEFTAYNVLTDEDREMLLDDIMNDELILGSINSRSNVSAHGPDGISNYVWKLGNKVTTRIIRITTMISLKSKRCPDLLKRGKTIMLFKKGDPYDSHSWRPITITPCFYRMWMVSISRAFQKLNNKHSFLSRAQKGFLQIPNATTEHGIMINELIQHVCRREGSLFITTIDFADAFGSAPHSLIFKTLEQKGFPQEMIGLIKATYDNTTTKIHVPKTGTSDTIRINCGVKQGCPLSPLMFNLCLDPLLLSFEKDDIDGFHFNGTSITAQAYADDLILFSDSERGMNNLLDKVTRFCEYTGMKVQPAKCRTFTYINHDDERSTALARFSISGEVIPRIPLRGGIPYLGTVAALQKFSRTKDANLNISKSIEMVEKICSSALKFNQMVDADRKSVV